MSNMPRGGGARRKSTLTYNEDDDDMAIFDDDDDRVGGDGDSEVIDEITPPVDEDGEEIFIVEKILDKRVVDGKIQYYLRWQGFTA